MKKIYLVSAMKGNPVFNNQTGEKIASFDDLMVAPESMTIQALVTSKGSILDRKIEAIPAEHVQVWGKDAVFVDDTDVVRIQEDLADFENWVSLMDDLRGRTVVSVDGKRVGLVDDFQITSDGLFAIIELSQVFVDGPVAETKEIPFESVRSLGPDVVIVDLQVIEPARQEDIEPQVDQNEWRRSGS